jgi:hypothetical protein
LGDVLQGNGREAVQDFFSAGSGGEMGGQGGELFGIFPTIGPKWRFNAPGRKALRGKINNSQKFAERCLKFHNVLLCGVTVRSAAMV